ncbi:hypothetical protein OHA25_56575 [Nonomuraea sp. NBC_00507]|uniref:pentapeptide repeat-containing protein n=1 Tax=Nonomuraea sp. NBC_00507 TaxID=2976002 RepID=UPI002E182294
MVIGGGLVLLGVEGFKPEKQLTSTTLFDLLKIAFAVVAGLGALVALVVAYRRQKVAESAQWLAELADDRAADAARREATKLHNERFASAAGQLGHDSAAVRLAGAHALAGLADDAPTRELRQTCIDVLCAYLRIPYSPQPSDDAPEAERLAFAGLREVRHTVIRLISAHLRKNAAFSWQGHDFDLTGVLFDGGDFAEIVFSDGKFDFTGAVFNGGVVNFSGAEFSGGQVIFYRANFLGGSVGFTGCKFSGGTVSFTLAEFCGAKLYFGDSRFSESEVSFRGAVFSEGSISFEALEISGGAINFAGAEFSGSNIHFHGSTLSGGHVAFNHSVLSGGKIDFHWAKFSGCEFDFNFAKFQGTVVDLRDARDYSVPPKGLPNPAPEGLKLPTRTNGSLKGPEGSLPS